MNKNLQNSFQHNLKFLDLFNVPIIDSHALTAKSRLNVFMLRLDGGKFDYEKMHEILGEASLTYAVSRSFYKEKYDQQAISALKSHVDKLFRNAEANDGEGGGVAALLFSRGSFGRTKNFIENGTKD
jgi:hypothetical protein